MRMGTCRSYDVVMGPPLCVFQSSLDVQSLESFQGYAHLGVWGRLGRRFGVCIHDWRGRTVSIHIVQFWLVTVCWGPAFLLKNLRVSCQSPWKFCKTEALLSKHIPEQSSHEEKLQVRELP